MYTGSKISVFLGCLILLKLSKLRYTVATLRVGVPWGVYIGGHFFPPPQALPKVLVFHSGM